MHRIIYPLLILIVVAAACGPDFRPYWKVDKFRLLSIQADPVVAKQGEPVTLSALIYNPDEADVDYDWSWCPLRTSADDDHECAVDTDDFGDVAPDGDSDDSDGESNGAAELPDDIFDLGDSEEATFLTPFDEEQVRQFCEAIQRQFTEEVDDDQLAELLPTGDCEDGYEISVRLEVTAGDASIIGSKRLTLWGGGDEYNKNPVIDDFQMRPEDPDDLSILIDRVGWDADDNADHDDQWVSVPDDEPLDAVESVPLEFRTLIDPDSLQTYTPSGADEAREEGLVYRHFTTAGTINTTRRIYGPDNNTLETASNAVHQMGSDQFSDPDECLNPHDDGCILYLWTVVRDGRLGVDWVERTVVVEPNGGSQ